MDGRIFGLDIQLGFDVIMQGIAVFIMFALLSYILFEPVRKILEDRKNRIADEIDQAAADQAEAAKDVYKRQVFGSFLLYFLYIYFIFNSCISLASASLNTCLLYTSVVPSSFNKISADFNLPL